MLHDEGIDTPLSISVYDQESLSAFELDTMNEEERYLYQQSLIRTYYYHRDHQNSILSLTDREGKIVESYSYDAYGKIIHSTKSVETYNPYGYTGREIDAPDLYYYRARYYDPTIGRFITPDPIGFMGGDTNFYRYVGNDPVNFTDPSGLNAFSEYLNLLNPMKDNIAFLDTHTSVTQPTIPNSNIPKIRTAAQIERHNRYQAKKLALAKQKAAALGGASNSTGTMVSGNPKKKVDEKCKDQKWHDPIDNPQLARYSQNGHIKPWANVFGMVRIKNGLPHMHQGVDLLAMPNTLIYACVDGIIANIQYSPPSTPNGANYGHQILLKAKCPTFARSQKKAYSLPFSDQNEMEKEAGYNEGVNATIYFFYAHLIETLVHIGDEVKAGQIIGKTGTSGYGTSKDPHLHFEIRSSPAGNRINPGFYVKYKLPNELTAAESANQTNIAQHQQGDPSPQR